MTTPTSNKEDTSPSPLTITFLAVTVVFFSLGLFLLYLYKCHRNHAENDPSTNPNPDPANVKPRTGLDPSLILAFPTLVYSNVKHLRQENTDLECAICLSEFQDVSVLRLLTVCYHVFHQECIDLWLESHTSCPVCRANLDLPQEKILEKLPNMWLHGGAGKMADINEDTESVFEDAVSIQIEIDHEAGRVETNVSPVPVVDRHRRWHSTGDSITKRKGEEGSAEGKYTLRLPENVKVKVTKMGHGGRSVTCGGVSDHHQLGLGDVVRFGSGSSV